MSKERDPNSIYLSVVREGDCFKIVDQDGRRVHGVKHISLEAPFDDLVVFTAEIIDASVNPPAFAHVGRSQ